MKKISDFPIPGEDEFNQQINWACRNGQKENIGFLIEVNKQAFDLKQWDQNWRTAYHFASYYGHTEIVQLLIQNGVDINQTNNFG